MAGHGHAQRDHAVRPGDRPVRLHIDGHVQLRQLRGHPTSSSGPSNRETSNAGRGPAGLTIDQRPASNRSRLDRPGRDRRKLARRESHHRHRRPAQRRQEHPVQRADQERRARGELPVRHHRAQRRRGRAARRAAGQAGRDLRLAEDPPAPVSFVDIAGLVRGASKGQGRGNAFLANIRDASAICQVVRAFSDPNVVHVDGKVSPGRRHRDDQHRADPGRPADPGEGAAPAGEGGQAPQGPGRRRRRREGRPSSCSTAAPPCTPGPPPPASTLDAAARAAPAHHQAVPLRLQRRRGRAGQRRRSSTSCAPWSPRPRRSSWTPRSSPS